MLYFTKDAVLRLHDHIIYHYGGETGVLHEGLVDSAAQRPRTVISNIEMYNGCIAKASSLAYALISWHPFVDENKRTALYSMANMLAINEIYTPFPPYLIKYSLLVAREKMTEEEFTKRIDVICAPNNSLRRFWKHFRYYTIPSWELKLLMRYTPKGTIEKLVDWLAAGDYQTLQTTLKEYANMPQRTENPSFRYMEGDIIDSIEGRPDRIVSMKRG